VIYRIAHGLSAPDFFPAFSCYNSSSTSGHRMKLMKQFCRRVNSRVFCFSNRCIDARNNLCDDIVFASSVCAFKNRLKRVDFS